VAGESGRAFEPVSAQIRLTFEESNGGTMSREPPDTALMRAVASGDKQAFQALYMRHNVPVFRYIVGFVRDHGAAEDTLHDVFLEVWRNAAKFDARSSASTWIIGIARFKAIDALRKRRGEVQWHAETDTRAEQGSSPEASAISSDRAQAIRQCLGALSLEHREIIDLVYYHGKSVRDVAEIVGIPENTVKTRMFHARRKLKDALIAIGVDAKWP